MSKSAPLINLEYRFEEESDIKKLCSDIDFQTR